MGILASLIQISLSIVVVMIMKSLIPWKCAVAAEAEDRWRMMVKNSCSLFYVIAYDKKIINFVKVLENILKTLTAKKVG